MPGMADVEDPDDRRASLSETKRKLLQMRLQAAGSSSSVVNAIPPRPDPTDAPLSSLQEGLWLMAQLEPHNPAFHRPVGLRLTGALDRFALEQALNAILRRHETLRGRFQVAGGNLRQQIASPESVSLHLGEAIDVGDETAALKLAVELACRSFDLENGKLLHADLVRLGPDEHLLLLVFHHLVFDAWSERILLKELKTLYTIFAGEQSGATINPNPAPIGLPELPIQYADFAAWQRSRLAGDELKSDFEYWLNRLTDAPPALALLPDHRPQTLSNTAGLVRVNLPMELLSGLKALASQHGATFSMALLTGFLLLLQRFSGQDDLLIGLLVAGRERVETEKLIGLFVNTLPLRVDLSGNPGFLEALERVRQASLEAYDHQSLPFVELARRAHLVGDPSRPPLTTLFNFENLPVITVPDGSQPARGIDQTAHILDHGPALNSDLTFELWEFDSGAVIYDLSLELIEKPSGLQADWLYPVDLYDAGAIQRLAEYYVRLLRLAVENPTLPSSRLTPLDENEQRQIVAEWNAASAWSHPLTPILQLIWERAASAPEAPALVSNGRVMTYSELTRRAGQLAAELRRRGLRPGDRAALYLERSPEMVVALLAILAAGAAFVPLDPQLPLPRLNFILKDSQASCLLTSADLIHSKRPVAGKSSPGEAPGLDWQSSTSAWTIHLDAENELIFRGDSLSPENVSPQHPAYILYTSGSTGQPKGVVMPHRALSNHAGWTLRYFDLSPQDIVLHATALSFDMSLPEILDTLVAGARIIVAPPGWPRDPSALLDLIRETAVTMIQMTPVMLKLLMDQPGFAACSSLRYVLCGGEAMPPELPGRFAACSSAVLYNMYGPTECCVDAAGWQCPAGWEGVSVPIGKPVDNCQAYILDRDLQPVPIGAPGELYIGGCGLAHGYQNRPGLTAEKFIPNPFEESRESRVEGQESKSAMYDMQSKTKTPNPELRTSSNFYPLASNPSSTLDSRLYRTGDRARFLPDGSIEFLGRIDRQVKLRGYRIEPAEIEGILLRQPGVVAAVVALIATKDCPRLAAFVTPDGVAALDEAMLRQALAASLPAYMLPAIYRFLPVMPLTPGGKIDYRALAEIGANFSSTEISPAFLIPAAPDSPLEAILTRLWAEVLEQPGAGANDDFFALGGHSLSAIRLAAKIAEVLRMEVPIRWLYEAPTPRVFAANLKVNTEESERLERIAGLLMQVADLSDEEALRRLEAS